MVDSLANLLPMIDTPRLSHLILSTVSVVEAESSHTTLPYVTRLRTLTLTRSHRRFAMWLGAASFNLVALSIDDGNNVLDILAISISGEASPISENLRIWKIW